MTTPKVINNIEFTQPTPPKVAKHDIDAKTKWLNERAFYTCNSEWNILEYMMKDNKVVIDKRDEKDAVGYLIKENSKNKTTGLFNSEKMLAEDDVKVLRDKMRKTGGNVWHGYISFRADQIEQISTQKQAMHFMKRTFNVFIDNTHLKRDNVEMVASLHTDRSHHHHIHYVFFEKQPLQRKNGKIEYSYKGEFRPEALDKWLVDSEFYLEQNNYYVLRDTLKRELDIITNNHNYAYNERQARQKIMELMKALPPQGSTQYADPNMRHLIPLVDETVNYLVKVNPAASGTYQKIQKELQYRQERAEEIVRRSNRIHGEENILKFSRDYSQKLKENLARRLGNQVIKMAKMMVDIEQENLARARYNNKIGAKRISNAINISIRTFAYSLPMTLNHIRRDFSESFDEMQYRLAREQYETENS